MIYSVLLYVDARIIALLFCAKKVTKYRAQRGCDVKVCRLARVAAERGARLFNVKTLLVQVEVNKTIILREKQAPATYKRRLAELGYFLHKAPHLCVCKYPYISRGDTFRRRHFLQRYGLTSQPAKALQRDAAALDLTPEEEECGQTKDQLKKIIQVSMSLPT